MRGPEGEKQKNWTPDRATLVRGDEYFSWQRSANTAGVTGFKRTRYFTNFVQMP
jgi:hypothetical protein